MTETNSVEKTKKTAKVSNKNNNAKDFLIICQDLVKIYRNRTIEVEALNGINLKIRRNEFLSVVGASGSGKTTLLNVLGGLDRPTSGTIIFDGDNIDYLLYEKRLKIRRKIGFVFQDFNLHPVLTASQNIELPMIYANRLTKPDRVKRVTQLLSEVGLIERANHIPAELSSGEKARVGIARALANEPILILADQPTGNLDTEIGSKIIHLLFQLQREYNTTICMVTHNLAIAEKTDRIITIKDGIILE
jgi:putative ABC transport system ATP-binding protein